MQAWVREGRGSTVSMPQRKQVFGREPRKGVMPQ
jgi:hypothetical protein